MDFELSDIQKDIRDLSRSILMDYSSPERLALYDEYLSERFDAELWQKICNAGISGISISDEYGGMGFGYLEMLQFIQEVGRNISAVPAISHLVSSVMPIQEFGSEEQKSALLPKIVSGELILTAALLEKNCEDPAIPIETVATKQDGGYLLTGRKICVPFAGIANYILISAKGENGVVVGLLDPLAEGVKMIPVRVTNYEPQSELILDNVFVPEFWIIGDQHQGENIMSWVLERTIVAVCAHQMGVTERALELTTLYTSERKQFGVPIATFQSVAHKAANCYIDIECLRLTMYSAAISLQREEDSTDAVCIAKIWAADSGHRVSYATQHLHGGTGIDRDYPLWRYCLSMRYNELFLGGAGRHLFILGERIAEGSALCD